MAGTIATYQGYPCRAVQFKRSRGTAADTTSVVFAAADFPAGFRFITPSPDDLATPTPEAEADIDLSAIGGPRVPANRRPAPRATQLAYEGLLVMAEVDRAGRQYVVSVPLFCIDVETLKHDSSGRAAWVRARLVDDRYFHGRGYVARWSYNRADGSGTISVDSTDTNSEPFTLQDIARRTARQLFRQPELTHVPSKWERSRPSVELAPFMPAGAALAKLGTDHGGGELCLNLDRSLALWQLGDGHVGYSEDGTGAGNSANFPAHLRLHKQGTGQASGLEAAYPPDYVLVSGEPRIASVRLGNWEPILIIEDEPIPLNEETIQRLTRGRGLDWLHKWILAPQAQQSDRGLDPHVARLLREQAYRLWRLPGAEIERGAGDEERAERRKRETAEREAVEADRAEAERRGVSEGFAPPQTQAGPRPRPNETRERRPLNASRSQVAEAEAEVVRRGNAEGSSTEKGPNAHLLPLLPRAETSAGRRLPILVESYTFHSVHRVMAPDREFALIADAQRRLKRLERDIETLAHRAGHPSPFHNTESFLFFQDLYASPQSLYTVITQSRNSRVSYEEFTQALAYARLVDRINEVAPNLAAAYEQGLNELFGTDNKLNGSGADALYRMAKEIVEFEKTLRESRSKLGFETIDEELADREQELRNRIQDELREISAAREEAERRKQAGGGGITARQVAQFIRNLPIAPDKGARVVSHEKGIIRTSQISGHVEEEGVPTAESTSFKPRPPRVTFGARVRPRVDRPMVEFTSVSVGAGFIGNITILVNGDDRIPEVLTDEQSHFVACFKRVPGRPPERIEARALPQGMAHSVRTKLVELVPLLGEGNRAQLEHAALEIATNLTVKPETVESARYTIGRPWPVNCDGVVAAVTITLRPNGKGFETVIYTGGQAPQVSPLYRSVYRGKRGSGPDAATREGLK